MTKTQIMNNIDKSCVKSSKVIKGNTVEYITNEGTRIIRFYETNIIIFHTDDTVELNTNGYKTVTTKERINEFSPFNIFQKDHTWYIDSETLPFTDGIRLNTNP